MIVPSFTWQLQMFAELDQSKTDKRSNVFIRFLGSTGEYCMSFDQLNKFSGPRLTDIR